MRLSTISLVGSLLLDIESFLTPRVCKLGPNILTANLTRSWFLHLSKSSHCSTLIINYKVVKIKTENRDVSFFQLYQFKMWKNACFINNKKNIIKHGYHKAIFARWQLTENMEAQGNILFHSSVFFFHWCVFCVGFFYMLIIFANFPFNIR